MTIAVITRWTTPDVAASTEVAKRAKAIWTKHGALEVRLNQIFTGPHTGQYAMVMVFQDMAAYARAQASAMPEVQPLFADNNRIGAVMHERQIRIGIDI